MSVSMTRLILYVRDVALLKSFYQTHFDLAVTEEIEGEWVVLKAGEIEIALHLPGPTTRSQYFKFQDCFLGAIGIAGVARETCKRWGADV
jgi:predicted enzyme related to lactoylglutathione lyase